MNYINLLFGTFELDFESVKAFKRGPEPDPLNNLCVDVNALVEYPQLVTHFNTFFERGAIDVCWLWQGGRNQHGYGFVMLGGRGYGAHRVAYAAHHGPIPEGLVVRHKCDNPRCVNPYHLEVGTHQDNADDRMKRGRGRPMNVVAEFTDADKREVLEAHATGEDVLSLAVAYDVTAGVIRAIIAAG